MVAVTASQCWLVVHLYSKLFVYTRTRARALACTYVNKKRSSAAAAAVLRGTAARIIDINGSVDSEISARFVDQARCRIDLERAKRSVRARSLMSAYWKFTCFDSIIHAHTFTHTCITCLTCRIVHNHIDTANNNAHTHTKNSLL